MIRRQRAALTRRRTAATPTRSSSRAATRCASGTSRGHVARRLGSLASERSTTCSAMAGRSTCETCGSEVPTLRRGRPPALANDRSCARRASTQGRDSSQEVTDGDELRDCQQARARAAGAHEARRPVEVVAHAGPAAGQHHPRRGRSVRALPVRRAQVPDDRVRAHERRRLDEHGELRVGDLPRGGARLRARGVRVGRTRGPLARQGAPVAPLQPRDHAGRDQQPRLPRAAPARAQQRTGGAVRGDHGRARARGDGARDARASTSRAARR